MRLLFISQRIVSFLDNTAAELNDQKVLLKSLRVIFFACRGAVSCNTLDRKADRIDYFYFVAKCACSFALCMGKQEGYWIS